jgi:hypothetical protein
VCSPPRLARFVPSCATRSAAPATGGTREAGERHMTDKPEKQLLHLVFGGELDDLDATTFVDLKAVDIVGLFPSYSAAHAAWKSKAQASVDNANMRYFIAHLHRLLDPAS